MHVLVIHNVRAKRVGISSETTAHPNMRQLGNMLVGMQKPCVRGIVPSDVKCMRQIQADHEIKIIDMYNKIARQVEVKCKRYDQGRHAGWQVGR
jgi:hypothetical protein